MTVAVLILLGLFAVSGLLCLLAACGAVDWLFTSAQSILGRLPIGVARPVAAVLGIVILFTAFLLARDAFPELF